MKRRMQKGAMRAAKVARRAARKPGKSKTYRSTLLLRGASIRKTGHRDAWTSIEAKAKERKRAEIHAKGIIARS